MMGYANKDAFEKTFTTNKLTFFSRTRNTLWTKGETSGHFLDVVKLRADCDRDTVLATVVPHGGACHTGSFTCFGSDPDEKSSMERLYATIAERFANPRPGSYTATLNDKRVREKVMEEAEELTEAEGKEEVVWEAADVLYFISVLMTMKSKSLRPNTLMLRAENQSPPFILIFLSALHTDIFSDRSFFHHFRWAESTSIRHCCQNTVVAHRSMRRCLTATAKQAFRYKRFHLQQMRATCLFRRKLRSPAQRLQKASCF